MDKILNFAEALDVGLLDQVIDTLFRASSEQERANSQNVLTQLKDHPDAWTRVDTILEYSRSSATKFFGLQILEEVIKYKWKILPPEQRNGIKSYIVQLIIKMSSDEAALLREKTFLGKLNLILVQVLKQEWPHNWPSFIPDIVGSSRTSETLCENNMAILRLLSEEVFDFSNGQMTQAKIKELKTNFNNEFAQIYQLCEFILNASNRPSLLSATLKTLLRFLNWIPLGYIFETPMVDLLINKFLPNPTFQNDALKCLAEIASLNIGTLYDVHFAKLYCIFMKRLAEIIPPSISLAKAYETGTEDQQNFIEDLSLFFTGFFKSHLNILESPEHQPTLLDGMSYLVSITEVDEMEIFKICLEYWNHLASDLYHTESQYQTPQHPLLLGALAVNGLSPRRALYSPILSRVRMVLISRMAKPEEVLIVEDENGEIVREVMKDSDAITLYKSMRETLIFLTHLNYEDTENIMLEKLQLQVDGQEWSWHNLNTLCWAIGSISGAMSEDDEKRFLVTVIKDLLGMCEAKRGKDNKAVIASNIMYVVGQYPRFLRAHWKFLKTVVNKLFEFMHETHPGVQDMACDTFLKIAQKCRRKFVQLQMGESMTFADELLQSLTTIIADLEASQIHTFYEAVGNIISSQSDSNTRDRLLARLMDLPNNSWAEMMSRAAETGGESLKSVDTMKQAVNILKTNVRVATALGHPFITQLGRIYLDMLNVYKAYSEMITQAIASGGPNMVKSSIVRSMRAVKKETLRLIETFIERTEDVQVVLNNFVPPLMDPVLGDYNRALPDSRDPEVLSLFGVIITKLGRPMTNDVPRIFEAVFDCTLQMITRNMEDYPEHRIAFFNLIRAINTTCFPAFFMIPEAHFKLVIDSIVWAFKHTERNIAETGLNILHELLKNVATSEVANLFYQTYFLSILQDIFFVLTDTFHMPGFKLQATILQHMFALVETGQVTAPLFDTAQHPGVPDNRTFLREYVITLLSNAFPNLLPNQVRNFVVGLFDPTKDLQMFKAHLRDFLVQTKEFGSRDSQDLFDEEKQAALDAQRQNEEKRQLAVPGLVAPYNPLRQEDGMADS
mmetsp:Transcript_26423/g.43268  ORF Transcript_26423/g.43268 Transcript_26423/m.43268 type:complete len:1071 (-) Transcript_26423:573-3785(-)|eukprot:CAMPEP_0184334566 /NCGR_PEP_ID=MMETSP1089-20130417/3313_1 /TAXON_ID=38269 ORGANISM="Gloeochaete wittrockiana, Strain SAG46.84" /NCGR_SAMPLE_ID=MMETSP1089 /ASSEMBLY_ACC=CAM_ASM_000445 /LENGTH=1070 /DNA_ID=CAMNT_0026658871 /DNA_START=76 /DNA_END=3288 /DNA_ORIENTATION=+